MKNGKWLILVAVSVCMVLSEAAFGQGKVFVVTQEGNRVYGSKLEADRQGNVTLYLGDGQARRTFRKGQYKAAYVPRPAAVRKLQAAFSQGEFDYIDRNAEKVLDDYGYVGWGDMIMYIRAKVALDRENNQRALEYLKRGNEYPGVHRVYWARGMAETYVALQEYDKANRYVELILDRVDTPAMLSAMFNLKGKMLSAQGKRKEAVLEYMKTLLLFDKKEVAASYEEARNTLVELMKSMNDSRYTEIESL